MPKLHPLGRDAVATVGSFYIVVAPGAAERTAVRAFVAWLKEEVRRDVEQAPEIIGEAASVRRRRTTNSRLRAGR